MIKFWQRRNIESSGNLSTTSDCLIGDSPTWLIVNPGFSQVSVQFWEQCIDKLNGFVACSDFLKAMKLTWTFYPKGEPSITLAVMYVPQLDAFSAAGYLEVDTNTAYVSWANFRVFNSTDQSAKKALFGSLIRVDRFNASIFLLP